MKQQIKELQNMKSNKKLYTLLLFFFCTCFCFCAEIDSMRVCGDKTLRGGIIDTDREAFLRSNSYDVDTMIYDKQAIVRLRKTMNRLKAYETLIVDTKHIDMDSVQSEIDGESFLYRYEKNCIDNKLLIRIYHNNQEDWYWIGYYDIDIEKRRCRLSRKLIKILSKYSDLWIDKY